MLAANETQQRLLLAREFPTFPSDAIPVRELEFLLNEDWALFVEARRDGRIGGAAWDHLVSLRELVVDLPLEVMTDEGLSDARWARVRAAARAVLQAIDRTKAGES